MAEITGGSVTYGRTINTGDYNSKKAEVTLTFALGEGENAEGAAEQAVFLCHKILTQISAGAASRSASSETAHPATEEAPADPKPATTRKPRATKPPTTAVEPTPLETAIENTPATTDPAAVEEPSTAPSGATAAATASADASGGTSADASGGTSADAGFDPDPASIEDEFSPQPREVTDVEMTSLAAKVNGKLNDPAKIRALVGKYVQHPKKMTDIPQSERGKFIEELGALGA